MGDGKSVTVTKLSSRYFVEYGEYEAYFDIDLDGEVTFYTSSDGKNFKQFTFRDSTPTTLRSVAMLLNEAAKLAEAD